MVNLSEQSLNGREKVRQNKLRGEKSPYLLQHVDNPVDWYPWGKEAFDRSRKQNKPIFLSIGYSTCHWCHVMEHESFEDEEVASLMNETFVCIKVDREERPDIDNIYMSVCQMMTGSGGWPLTILMTPERKPFFAGTYFPRTSRIGRIGMVELVRRVQELWKEQQQDLLNSADKITGALRQNVKVGSKGEKLDEAVLKKCYNQLAGSFDENYGGFSIMPKFPTAHNFIFLLHYWKRTGDDKALEMVEKTLRAMRRGGIFDHIGFGFHRYSTDQEWLVPHFEKMLYDQALLAMAYLDTYQATGKKEYAETAREIFTYVLRDLTSPEGGFYSAEDADSEGEEGKFYLWTEKEIRKVLGREEAELAAQVFHIKKEGNFVGESTGRKNAMNIPHQQESWEEMAEQLKISKKELRDRWDEIREKLFAVRKKRIHPYKDDKILADWNGLMIAALAKGGRILEEPVYVQAAEKAMSFIHKRMVQSDGRLWHRYRQAEAGITAHLDDYAFVLWGLLELYESTFKVDYLRNAIELNRDMIELYWDRHGSGFFFTAHDSEKLLIRHKDIYDGAVPSGNSVAMLNLLRLGRLTANVDLESRAGEIGRIFGPQVSRSPSAHTQLLVAVDFGLGPTYEVVIVGNPARQDTKNMLKTLRGTYIPNKVVLLRPIDVEAPEIVRLAKFIQNYRSIEGKATAYVCQNYRCRAPTTEIAELLEFSGKTKGDPFLSDP